MRLFNIYKALSKWHEITLLTSTHVGGEEERVMHGAGFNERRIPKDDYFVQQYALLAKLASGGDLSGPAIAACSSFPTRLHQAYLEEYAHADVIIHDDPFTADYDLFAGLDRKPRVYNAYNCETRLYRQLHPGERSRPIHDLVAQAEVRMLEKSDLVLYCNDDDLQAFREMTPTADFDAVYTPNGMNPVSNDGASVKHGTERFRAVFMGSGHPPNAHAAGFIVRELASKLPDIEFDFIGSCLPEGRYPDNVHRHGIVTDELKSQLLHRSNLAINPMAAGSGSNVKVLDYFAHGLPVLSTAFGMRGIHAEAGQHYLEADLAEFADAIRTVTAAPGRLEPVALAGRQLGHERYTWEAIAAQAGNAIEQLSATKTLPPGHVLALNDYDSFEGVGGGGTRTRGLYLAVSQWSPVVFLCFSDKGKLQARHPATNVTVITVPKTHDHLAEQHAFNAQFHVSSDDIVASRHCRDNPYLDAIYRVLRQGTRCIVAEHCYMVGLPGAWGDRFVYSSQNHELALKRRLLEGHPNAASLLSDVEALERFAVEDSAATVAVSHEDAEALVRGKQAAGPVIVVRNGAAVPAQGDAVSQARVKVQARVGERSVVFLGSAHMPNIEAARFITDQLAGQCPEVDFHLLGSVGHALPQVPPNVRIWGVVDDETKSAIMQSCALALNPMLSGSGSNVKLADYIGNGLFVVTTEFGQRGYPQSVRAHIEVTTLTDFAVCLRQLLARADVRSDYAREQRKALFQRELSMQGLASRFVGLLQGMESKRKRILYVTYRYVAPAMGGAEVNHEKFVSALGHSGEFDVDVVSPEISAIHSHWRFGERYSFDADLGVPVDIPNVRFARFTAEAPPDDQLFSLLRKTWQVQPLFERRVSQALSGRYGMSGLSWGWGYAEGEPGYAKRPAFTECGLFLKNAARVRIEGYAPHESVITVRSGDFTVAGPSVVNGQFELNIDGPAGELMFSTTAPLALDDPRPLGFAVSRLSIAGDDIDLTLPMLYQRSLNELSAETCFQTLDEAAESTRAQRTVQLTDTRGPWSPAMERFIADHIAEYDLVVANNNVFRPAVLAMAEAKKQGIPSILIPHAHLDDDFYHFPDWLRSAREAGLVLAVPRVACDFLARKGCNVRYLPAGCNAGETFTDEDVEAFRRLYPSRRPFILVLGRKAGAKGYRVIIEVVERLNREGIQLDTVLIGPDDDGVAIKNATAFYLGRQSRDVVRGALRSCFALCNMSTSESFGIVLLEAWLAGRPVIANRQCAAFHDMALDDENALLVEPDTLGDAIKRLRAEPELAGRLAKNGIKLVERFDWNNVTAEFVSICREMAAMGAQRQERVQLDNH